MFYSISIISTTLFILCSIIINFIKTSPVRIHQETTHHSEI
nr:MAG TPA: hypothetical protein [Caudoviricetes sp.]